MRVQGQRIVLEGALAPPAVMVWKITNGDKEQIRKLEVADDVPQEVGHTHIMESAALFPVYSLANATSTLTVLWEKSLSLTIESMLRRVLQANKKRSCLVLSSVSVSNPNIKRSKSTHSVHTLSHSHMTSDLPSNRVSTISFFNVTANKIRQTQMHMEWIIIIKSHTFIKKRSCPPKVVNKGMCRCHCAFCWRWEITPLLTSETHWGNIVCQGNDKCIENKHIRHLGWNCYSIPSKQNSSSSSVERLNPVYLIIPAKLQQPQHPGPSSCFAHLHSSQKGSVLQISWVGGLILTTFLWTLVQPASDWSSANVNLRVPHSFADKSASVVQLTTGRHAEPKPMRNKSSHTFFKSQPSVPLQLLAQASINEHSSLDYFSTETSVTNLHI